MSMSLPVSPEVLLCLVISGLKLVLHIFLNWTLIVCSLSTEKGIAWAQIFQFSAVLAPVYLGTTLQVWTQTIDE